MGGIEMIGARHAAGSTISNGGDSSPLGWVIVGRRPWESAALEVVILPEKRSFYEYSLSISQSICQAKKVLRRLERIQTSRKCPPSLISALFRYKNSATSSQLLFAPLHPKFTLCRA